MHLAPPVLLPLASYSAFIIGSIILAYSQYHPVASFNWHNHPPPRNIRAATGPVSMSRALDVETSADDDDDDDDDPSLRQSVPREQHRRRRAAFVVRARRAEHSHRSAASGGGRRRRRRRSASAVGDGPGRALGGVRVPGLRRRRREQIARRDRRRRDGAGGGV